MEKNTGCEHELLAPAGSYETLRAVVDAGADAVYVGGSRFGARAYADNLTETELLEAIDYCHLHGKKLYLTVNTLLKEQELAGELAGYLRPYYRQGLDAVIVQDPGVFRRIRREFPDLPVHASTQMTVTGSCGAAYLKRLGAARIVTARELSLSELRRIHDETNVEIECFIHGALCYCYSGQCLLSSMLGGRSGNRGRCAQPCRLPYEALDRDGKTVPAKGAFVLSPKDLCTIRHLPALAESGVYSFKIEGRMKQTAYAAGVVSIYRRYLDGYLRELAAARARRMPEQEARAYAASRYRVDEEDLRRLFALGNRSGFTDGYLCQRNGPDMITFQRPNHAKTERQAPDAAGTQPQENKEKIKGTLILNKDFPARIEVSFGEAAVTCTGEVVQAAQKQPLSAERVGACIRKTGNTPFVFEELEVRMDGEVFLPVQALNALRRQALDALYEELMKRYRREDPGETEPGKRGGTQPAGTGKAGTPDPGEAQGQKIRVAVSVETEEQLQVALEYEFVNAVYLDSICYGIPSESAAAAQREMTASIHRAGRRAYLILPAVFRNRTADRYRAQLEAIAQTGVDGFVVKNCDALGFMLEAWALMEKRGLSLLLDHSLYSWTCEAQALLLGEDSLPERAQRHGRYAGAGRIRDTVPLELNRREIAARDNRESEMVVYGYLPLMTSAQCIHANTSGTVQKRVGAMQRSVSTDASAALQTHAKTLAPGCDSRQELLYLKDRYGRKFPVKNHCGECYNTIYNTTPLMLFDSRQELEEMGITRFRLSFTVEDAAETARILKLFQSSFLTGEVRAREVFGADYTNGHYRRGVE